MINEDSMFNAYQAFNEWGFTIIIIMDGPRKTLKFTNDNSLSTPSLNDLQYEVPPHARRRKSILETLFRMD